MHSYVAFEGIAYVELRATTAGDCSVITVETDERHEARRLLAAD